ncbi:unnamed protein product [Victoria cruziana]
MAAVVPWCASSASSSSSSGRSLRPSSASRTPLVSPFLGSVQGRVSLVHSVRKAPSLKVGKSFQVRCQEAVIPKEQRWMFEPSEIDGPDIWNKTWYPKAADHENTKKTWYIVDATDKILGRLASTIAIHIRGKNLAAYTPSVDMGAYVIVINAEKVAVSGKKRTQKLYRRHSGRPGGMKVETFDQLQKRIPERIVEHAVRGMLPKGRVREIYHWSLKI